MFTINKCSLGWRVSMNDADGKSLDEATFQSMDDACDYLKRWMRWLNA